MHQSSISHPAPPGFPAAIYITPSGHGHPHREGRVTRAVRPRRVRALVPVGQPIVAQHQRATAAPTTTTPGPTVFTTIADARASAVAVAKPSVAFHARDRSALRQATTCECQEMDVW